MQSELLISELKAIDKKTLQAFYDGTPLAKLFEQFEFSNKAAHLVSDGSHHIICENGEVINFPDKEGLTFSSLAEKDIKNLRKNNPLSSIHEKLTPKGIKIKVEKNFSSSLPLKFSHISKGSNLNTSFIYFEIERGAKLTLIEDQRNPESSELSFSEVYFLVHDNAHVEHIQLFESEEMSLRHNSYFTDVERDGTYRNIAFSLGGKLNRINTEIRLKGPGSHGEISSVYLTDEKEQADLFTEIHHESADTTSAQIAKGILAGSSKGIFTGKIHIYPGAQRVASSQINRNLLLSSKANALSRPQLEIFADDVKCSHGSTTGQISKEELFYFESRGIPEDKARTLLAFGFGLEVVLKIQNKYALEEVKEIISQALQRKFQIAGVL
jgi:Fe-S cluster assembly protein SufD